MQPRDHHYYFAHAYFRHLVFDKPEYVYSTLKNKKLKDQLINMWYQVTELIKPEKNKIKKLLPVGLTHSFYQNNGKTILIVEMPKPEFMTEVYYIGVIFSDDFKQIRYFTLEYSFNFAYETNTFKKATAILCEWTETSHRNYAYEIFPPTKEKFIEVVNQYISIDTTKNSNIN